MANLASHFRSACSRLLPFLRPLKHGLLAALLMALYSLALPNYYTSVVNILPVDAKGVGGLGSLASAAAAFGLGIPGQDGAEATYVDILNSRWMRENLLNTGYRFHTRSWAFAAPMEQNNTLLAYLKAKNIDFAVEKLGEVLAASRDPKTKVLTITVVTKSPELSQQVAQKAVNLLETFVQKTGQTRGGYKAAFAGSRLLDARKEMAKAEEELQHFLDGNRNYTSSTDPFVRLRGLRLEGELKLRQQLLTTLALNLEQALMEEKNDIPILNVLDPANLPINKSRPSRASLVLAAFFAIGLVSWAWGSRAWLRFQLMDAGTDQGEGGSSLPKEKA